MRGIGGNTLVEIQIVSQSTVNEIGERVKTWETVQRIYGWLDFLSGEAKRTNFNSKIEESSHVFICDFVPLQIGVKADTARLICDGQIYDITLIDNPMGLKSGSQWEIYLKYTGKQ